MNKRSSKDKGNEAEQIAAAYLESKGWIVLDQNYIFERAEVDIVAFDNECIIFVEVKYRSNTFFGEPEEFIDEVKEKNIHKAAEAWMYERRMEGSPARFDVISIVQKNNKAPEIKHFVDAFR